MKYPILCFVSIVLLWNAATIIAQETAPPAILKADSNWEKEIIKFPIDWAPGMDLVGYEELRFAPNWKNPDHEQFWTLAIAYKVQTPEPLSLSRIEQNFEAYFNGLMQPNHWAQHFPDPVFKLVSVGHSALPQYQGKLKVFDGFHTGKMITINVQALQRYYPEKNQAVVVFYLSPKNYDHSVWREIKSIGIE
ncbi:MAG: hypothetical protein CMC13_07830 [Flavobacteriaceae bacterium]|nr:hypothetical protein [Flavobacteriaceae bacterium]|tara:strand:- start:1274 stop:1849 length:576 start_codon:yes stop_codon:yes gene_type:complete